MHWPAALARAASLTMATVLIVLPIVWLDRLCSSTVLLTPVSPILWKACLIVGCALGLVPASQTAVLVWFQPGPKGRQVWRTVATVLLFGPIFTPFSVLVSARIAYRLTELASFTGTAAPLRPTLYRVHYFGRSSHAGKSYHVDIDPYRTGFSTEVPIPGVDYRRLLSASRQGVDDGFCVEVPAQRSGDAVRIRVTRVDDATASRLVWCPSHPAGD